MTIHRMWDRRAQEGIGAEDIVIFAEGDETMPQAKFYGADIDERFTAPDNTRLQFFALIAVIPTRRGLGP